MRGRGCITHLKERAALGKVFQGEVNNIVSTLLLQNDFVFLF